MDLRNWCSLSSRPRRWNSRQITRSGSRTFDPMRIIELIQKNKHIKLAGNEKLRIERELKEPKDRAQLVRDILRGLGQPLAQPALG